MVSFIVDKLQHLSPGVVYLTVGLLVFGEAALLIGFVLPGETAVIIGGFIASRGKINIVALCVLVVIAAIIGDTVGYFVGKRYGPRLLGLPLIRGRKASIAKALAGLEKRGPTYVFIGRFGAFFRAVVPGLAGMSEMHYRRFLLANAAGGLCWGLTFCLLGYFAGNAYRRIEHYSAYAAAGIAVVVLVLAVFFHLRAKRRDEAEESLFNETHPEPLGPPESQGPLT